MGGVEVCGEIMYMSLGLTCGPPPHSMGGGGGDWGFLRRWRCPSES